MLPGIELFNEPFPHLVMDPALSEEDYAALLKSFPDEMIVGHNPAKAYEVPTTDFSWKPAMATLIKELLKVQGEFTIGRFALRHAGYQLLPHLDNISFKATVIHYLPFPNQGPDAGTCLYKASEPLLRDWADRAAYFHRSKIPCELVKVVPFKPNTILAFPNTPVSAHGLAPLTESRRLYQWHFV
jgi:hypothetical protein